MAPKISVKNQDLNLKPTADKFSEYIDIVWKKIEEDKIEDIEKVGLKLRKCVTFFAAYIKYIPSYIDKALYLCRSILILIESKNLQWDLKYYGKLVIICCLNMLFGRSEDLIRESCNIMKEMLLKIQQDSLDVIVRKYSYYLALLMQRVLTVRTRLTQAMILEVIFKLTKNAADTRNNALKKQKFFARLNPAVQQLLLKSFKKIDHEHIENTSRSFLMTVNMLLNPKSGIITAEGCIYKIDNFENTEADTVHIDFNWREQSVSFTVETQIICAALKPTNIHYSFSKKPAYFELFFNSVELLQSEPTENEMDTILNIKNLMYKQDMNSALQEIDDVHMIQMTLLGNRENLAKFKVFYERFKANQYNGNLSNDKNESFLSLCTDVSFLDETFGLDDVNEPTIKTNNNENVKVDTIPAEIRKLKEPLTVFNDDEANNIEVPPQMVEIVRNDPLSDKENVDLHNFDEQIRQPAKESEQPKLVVTQEEKENENEYPEEPKLVSHIPEITIDGDVTKIYENKTDEIIEEEKQPWWKVHLQVRDRLLKIPKPKYPIVRPIAIKDVMRKEEDARKARAQEKHQKEQEKHLKGSKKTGANNQPKKRGRQAKQVELNQQASKADIKNEINQPRRKLAFSGSKDSDSEESLGLHYKTAPKTDAKNSDKSHTEDDCTFDLKQPRSMRHRPADVQYDTNYNSEESPLKQYRRGVGIDIYELEEEDAPQLPRNYKAYAQKMRKNRPTPVIVDPKMINPQLTPEKTSKDYMTDYWMDSSHEAGNFKVQVAVETESFIAENRKRWNLEVKKRAEEDRQAKLKIKLEKKQKAEKRKLKKIKDEESRKISKANVTNSSKILTVENQPEQTPTTTTISRKSKTPAAKNKTLLNGSSKNLKNARDLNGNDELNVTSTSRKSKESTKKSVVKKELKPRESPKRLSRRSKEKAKELLASMTVDVDESDENISDEIETVKKYSVTSIKCNVKAEEMSIQELKQEKILEDKNDSKSLYMSAANATELSVYLTAIENLSASDAWNPPQNVFKKPTNKRKSDYDDFLTGLPHKHIKTNDPPLLSQSESYQEQPLNLAIRKDPKMVKLPCVILREKEKLSMNKRKSEQNEPEEDLKRVKSDKTIKELNEQQPLDLTLKENMRAVNLDTKCEKDPYFGANCKENVMCVKMKFNADVAIKPIEDNFDKDTRNQRIYKFTELTTSQISEYLTSHTHQLALVPLNLISPKR